MNCRIVFVGLFGLILTHPARAQVPAEKASDIGKVLLPLIDAHHGKVTVAVKHLPSGATWFHHADDVMPTASLIKLAIMAEVYFQEKEGKVNLADKITLTKDEMVQGSGILTDHFSPGLEISLRDVVHLMIVYSDNTATNMVLEKVGIANVNTRMKALGYPETRINAKVFKGSKTSVDPARTKEYGLGSTTAKDSIALLEKLETKSLVSPKADAAMLDHLSKCDDSEKFPRYLSTLGKGIRVAHKTGSVNSSRTDAGIIYFTGGPVILCVMTDANADKTWTINNAGNKLCAEIAREVVKHYFEKKQ